MAGGGDQGEERSGGGRDEAEQEERTDGWMATYADMVTLLMTFFVLMFAISNVDTQKASLLFAALSRDGLTADQFQTIVDRYGEMDPSDDPFAERFPFPQNEDSPTTPTVEEGNPELDALYSMFSRYIYHEGLGEYISLIYNGEFLHFTLASDILFHSGSAEVLPPMVDTAIDLARMLMQTQNYERPFEIVVAGHTDNAPIATIRYPTNWHLSVDRAVNFMWILLHESDLNPAYFSARGFGEDRPLFPNDSSENMRRNRRVEVMVSRLRDQETVPR
jgi:chemotaxis protein MotB